MTGKLIVCPTPIGNMEDMTERGKRALAEADLIAAEDTRHTLGLLNHLGIKTPMISCHQHNEQERTEQILEKLREGQTVVLVSDAGTPAISDPGEILVRRCREEGILVTALPGACAFVTALSMSGMPSRRFVFEGFLPAGGKERRARLEALRAEERTVIFYEAPHHLRQTLSDLLETFGDRRLAMGRELTKRHEEMLQMKLSEAIAHYQDQEPRGEYVLILEGADPLAREREERARWEQMTLREHMALYSALPPKEAMKQVAKDRGVSKRDVYNGLLQEES
ncbi:MAG TPA: 16S rRNA (cytidine(1402)-2'-O)-methyltransferase [Candidatus Faecimorpha stercoravium]|nr:16S rRNA (cytidine(1402)-2'-O)-methyltransferase [Candidatus Faecimorpha stercoravium]